MLLSNDGKFWPAGTVSGFRTYSPASKWPGDGGRRRTWYSEAFTSGYRIGQRLFIFLESNFGIAQVYCTL